MINQRGTKGSATFLTRVIFCRLIIVHDHCLIFYIIREVTCTMALLVNLHYFRISISNRYRSANNLA